MNSLPETFGVAMNGRGHVHGFPLLVQCNSNDRTIRNLDVFQTKLHARIYPIFSDTSMLRLNQDQR